MSTLGNQLLSLAYFEIVISRVIKDFNELTQSEEHAAPFVLLRNALTACYTTLTPYKLNTDPERLAKVMAAAETCFRVIWREQGWSKDKKPTAREAIPVYAAIGLHLVHRLLTSIRTHPATVGQAKDTAYTAMVRAALLLYNHWCPDITQDSILFSFRGLFEVVDAEMKERHAV